MGRQSSRASDIKVNYTDRYPYYDSSHFKCTERKLQFEWYIELNMYKFNHVILNLVKFEFYGATGIMTFDNSTRS